MEPIEDTDPYSCDYCGHVGRVGEFRRPGKGGPNMVCPHCGFSTAEYHAYLMEKGLRASEREGVSNLLRSRMPTDRFLALAKAEQQIKARKAAQAERAEGGCMLFILAIPTALLALYACLN